MLENNEVVRLTFGDSLAYGHLRQVCYTLRQGGLCILPSDTCYSLAALPFRRDALAHLASILPEKNVDPIPLAFGALHLVQQYVKLTNQDEKLIDAYCPGPLTLVCEINDRHDKKIIEDMLHTHGTIGVRIPDSTVERQISIDLQRPITTCAIREDSGEPVRSFDDAVSLVRMRMKTQQEEFLLFAVRMTRLAYRDLSTVASVQKDVLPEGKQLVAPYSVFIYRPGILEPEQLENALRKIWPSDFEDWT
jgi:tRNA threonylcarbamoyl adenosine modification protein (Sua5/YciO/YrdC/YwlC family)